MLVKNFKFKRNKDQGGFPWTAESETEGPGFHRSFFAVGKTLADVKEFAALVRRCERTNSLERLSEMHPPGFESRFQSTWGGVWFPQMRKLQSAPKAPLQSETKTPPSPEANFAEFTAGLPTFLPAIIEGFSCISELALEANDNSLSPDAVIAMLTGSLAEDLQDVVILCASERNHGALRLLRTPYEKFLYASHISRYPEAARDFLMFAAIQARALSSGIESHYGYRISEAGQARLEEMFKVAQERFKRTKCTECGESGPRMWTKVTPEEMAKEAGLEKIHVVAYRYATLSIHPSYLGISDQANSPFKIPATLGTVFKLTFETIRLQWIQFKKTETVTGRTAELMRKLLAVAKAGVE